MSTPAGWHKQDDGRERYWDGQQWTDHYRGGTQAATATPKKGGWKHPVGYAATALVALLIGAAMGAAGGSGDATASAGPTITTTLPGSTVTTTVTPPAATTITKVATVKVTPKPKPAIAEGVWEVGVDIKPGKYKVIDAITSDCYWEIDKTGNPDDIVANDNVSGGRPVVILRKGQTFTNQGCGDWAKVG